MITKNNLIKEYSKNDELKTFCEQTWGDYIRKLDKSIISYLLSIQSHGLTQGYWFDDDKVIGIYHEELPKFPPVPFDILVYRGGDMKIPEKPFLSASFYKKNIGEIC